MKESDFEALQSWLGSGTINLFGRPFVGKDTQGMLLAKEFDASLLGGGEILRNSNIPEHIKSIMHAGQLVPTDDYIRIVLPYLQQDQFKGAPLILSSVGRWHGEEPGVLEATEQAGHPTRAVVHLELGEDAVRDRWHRKHESAHRADRHDDTLEILETRLQEYREKTLPVLEFYRQANLLIEINGDQDPEDVNSDILRALTARALGN